MSEKQYIKNRRVDDLATAPTPQNTPATASTLPTPASQAPTIPTITEEDGMSQCPSSPLCLSASCFTSVHPWVRWFGCSLSPVTRFPFSIFHELIALYRRKRELHVPKP